MKLTAGRFSKVAHASVGIAAVLSVILGVGGYYAFGQDTRGKHTLGLVSRLGLL
jgi:hypothetical protein